MSISCWALHIFVLQAYIYLPLFLPQTLEQTVATSLQLSQSYNLSKAVKAQFCTSRKKMNWTSFSELFVLQLFNNLGTELKDVFNSLKDWHLSKKSEVPGKEIHTSMWLLEVRNDQKVRSYKLIPKKSEFSSAPCQELLKPLWKAGCCQINV